MQMSTVGGIPWSAGRESWHCGGVWAGLTTALGVLAGAAVLGWWWRRRSGALRPTPSAPRTDLADLGVTPGTPVTLLQFSSAFCTPCRATRAVCADVARRFDGVRHVEVDAGEHLDAVRRLDIWRTPTVLVVDGTGAVVYRAAGTPSRAQVIAAIGPLLPAGAAR
jgi:thiol-disulfide isomerase/thioredoxin